MTRISLVNTILNSQLILNLISWSYEFLFIIYAALRTGLGMASARGELSLVIAKTGQDVGAVSSSVFPILGIVTIVTAFMTSYVIKFGGMIRLSSALASGERKKGS